MQNNIHFTDNSNKIIEGIQRLKENVEGKYKFHDVLTDDFVVKHTNFGSYQELMEASAKVSSDLSNQAKLDEFISKNTNFSSFQEMFFTAFISSNF